MDSNLRKQYFWSPASVIQQLSRRQVWQFYTAKKKLIPGGRKHKAAKNATVPKSQPPPAAVPPENKDAL